MVNQPDVIEFKGKEYTLLTPHKVISENPPLTEGPFYQCEGVDPADWAFLPDTRFLEGKSKGPEFMHVIQMRHFPVSQHPAME